MTPTESSFLGGVVMGQVLLVGLGGFIGSALRYVVSGLVHEWTGQASFPLGTLVVNVVGCLIIGVLAQIAEARGALTPEMRLFVVVGILGGFTTYSSFGHETVNLWRDGEGLLTFLNLAGHLVLGLGAVFVGRWFGTKLWA